MTVTRPQPKLTLVASAPSSDEQLCREFLQGDVAAFGELIRRHQELVYRLIRRYTHSADDARELTQSAFLRALEAARRTLPKLQARTENDVPFRAWLLRIAINVGKNHARDAGRWAWAPLEALDSRASTVATATEQMEEAERRSLTRRAVLELPRRQREVFTLRIDGGLPFAEVASTLGITENNAKSHFHHAMLRLRDEVQKLSGAR